MEELLPLGSVVVLKDGSKSLMVIGTNQYYSKGEQYDYVSVLYPEGHLNKDSFFLFNQEDIREVKYIGYVSAELQAFRFSLAEAREKNKVKGNTNAGE